MSQVRLQKHVRVYLKDVEKLGVEVDEVTTTGKGHYKVMLKKDDHRKMFIFSSSISDFRTHKNALRDVRHWLAKIE